MNYSVGEKAENNNSDAASIINSAMTLLNADSSDGDSILSLIEAAMTKLQ